MRDAEAWEFADAIGPKTAAVLWVAHPSAQPSLAAVAAVAHEAGVPVIVDAAAELPPASNLRRFLAEGADLVAFSGGKAIGGPQASGILAGRRDLIMAAALQMLDLDIWLEQFRPDPAFIDLKRLKGLPAHGIGRPCKVGKEQIVGLLTALDLFLAEDDGQRTARWTALLEELRLRLEGVDRLKATLVPGVVPILRLDLAVPPGPSSWSWKAEPPRFGSTSSTMRPAGSWSTRSAWARTSWSRWRNGSGTCCKQRRDFGT